MQKSMDSSGPWSDRLFLWIVTGSNGCLVLALKRRRSISFPPLYGIVWSIHLTLKQKSIEITLKPSPHSLNHSQISITLCLFLTFSVSITLSSLPLSLIAVAAQPRSLPHSLNHSLISASLPRRHRNSAQIATQPRSLPHSLNQSFISTSLPHRRRSSAQIAAHYLNHSLPLSHAHFWLSPSSPSQLTLCLIAIAVVWYFITSNLLILY